MALILLTESKSQLISLDEMKMHLRIDGTEQDPYLEHLLSSARIFVEQVTGLSLVKRTWRYQFDQFPVEKVFLYLPFPPVQSITSFQYVDRNGELKVLIEGSDFVVDLASQPARIAPLLLWPEARNQPNAVTIDYVSGFDSIPSSIKHAMLLLMGHWYEHRESVAMGAFHETPMSVDSLLAPYRIWRFQ
jgi:uncharacterized phiE125 gp8 family phage protein